MAAGKYSHPMGHIWVLGTAVIEVRKNFQHQNSWHFCEFVPFLGWWVKTWPLWKVATVTPNLGIQIGCGLNHLATEKKLTCQSSRILRNYTSIDKPECQTPKSPPYSKHVYIVSIHVTGFVKKPATSSCTTSSELRDGGPWRSSRFFFSNGSMDRMVWFSRWGH